MEQFPNISLESGASREEVIEAARVAGEVLARDAAARDREWRHPFEEVNWLKGTGLFNVRVPARFGGLGFGYGTWAQVLKHLAVGDPNVAMIPIGHVGVAEVVNIVGSEEQKAKIFGQMRDGVYFGNAITEIGTKTKNDMLTKVSQKGNGYVVDGRKFYTTGSVHADRIGVVGLNEEGLPLMAFVDADAEGVTIIDDWRGMGQRTTASGTMKFDNVQVDAFDVVAMYEIEEGRTILPPSAQLPHSAIDLGIALAALRDGKEFICSQARPWVEAEVDAAADDWYILRHFGQMSAAAHAADLMLSRAGDALDVAEEQLTDELLVKASIHIAESLALSIEVALDASVRIFQLCGTKSTLEQEGLDRHMRNARTHTLHNPVDYKYWNIGKYYLKDEWPPSKTNR